MTEPIPALVPAPIGVLCGGPSTEREISLRSGRAVWQALQAQGCDVRLLELEGADCAAALRAAGIRTAFIALHGAFGEDGTVQTLLESLGILYTGSGVAASRLAIDKHSARTRLAAAGIPVAAGALVPLDDPDVWPAELLTSEGRGPRGSCGLCNPQLPLEVTEKLAIGVTRWLAAHGLRLPVVVKPVRQGSSIGLTIVETPAEWPAALEEAARYDAQVLCEEYLPGPEVTVGILDDAALPIVQIVPQRRFYDYAAKYTPGLTQYLVPAPLGAALTAQVQAMARRAHRVLGCEGFSRVDLIVPPGRGPVVLEVNTIPGLTATSLLPKAAAAAGIPFPELCERLLQSAVTRRTCREEGRGMDESLTTQGGGPRGNPCGSPLR